MSLSIPSLSHGEQSTLNDLYRQYQEKLTRNRLRKVYYDSKNILKDLGIAIPPSMVNIDMALGWPAKAVDGLARRCVMDGFVIPGDDSQSLGIDALWDANEMDAQAPQAQSSAFIHACTFVPVTAGDTQSGEPPVLITPQSAMAGTGIWDPRRRRLSSALSIVDVSDAGTPTSLVMYLPDSTVSMNRTAQGWAVDRRKHSLGRVPVRILPYKPRLDRVFGSSRISRPVMSLADQALRTAVRMEVSAEFYSSPQRWIMGADESAFQDADGNVKGQWEAIIGRLWAAGANEDGTLPQVGQFNAASPQPHHDQMRMLATQFSGETGIPVGSLGVVQDNPSSAEAIYAAKEDLLIEAEYANATFGAAWVKVALDAMQIVNGWDEIPEGLRQLRVKWRDPATPSRSSAADAVVKMVSAMPWLAETTVALEQLGWDETTVNRALADKRRAGTGALIDRLGQVQPGASGGQIAAEDAAALKAKADAMGVLIRAGVDPDDAAARVGLAGLHFTGATPVALRLPESQAERLEDR